MKYISQLARLVSWVFSPIRTNFCFFCFMYILGLTCALNEITLHVKGATPYPLSALELFFDLYIICVILAVIPQKIRKWIRSIVCVILYMAAIIDVFCYVKFESTLTPTMLLLVGETDSREAGEFLSSYVTLDTLMSLLGWVLVIAFVHLCIFCSQFIHWRKSNFKLRLDIFKDVALKFTDKIQPVLGIFVIWLIVDGYIQCSANKSATFKLMSGNSIGEVEHTLTEKDHAVLYLPIYRLVFSEYANHLAAKQVEKLIEAKDKIRVDSCSYRSKNIILIIGESYNKYHSQLYGYNKRTTPRQKAMAKSGRLVAFDDVVAPWNLTSYVFKNVLSMHAVGEPGEWCDKPLFPELFRKAGYKVAFLTNQFLPQAKEAVYDFSGGFFINNPELSKAQFDIRNTSLHRYDDGVLADFNQLRKYDGNHNLLIFHLIGQHVNYKQRFPSDRKKFTADDYDRPQLSGREKSILADYDNAVLYNDSIVNEIVKKFENTDAIVIYMPDHGEECFNNDFHYYGRLHSAEIDARLAREEFEIPFWIWCSHKYAIKHPDIFNEIVNARHRPFMTDNLAHVLLYLAGISCPEYKSKANILSPDFDASRPRILKGTTDYNKLKKAK